MIPNPAQQGSGLLKTVEEEDEAGVNNLGLMSLCIWVSGSLGNFLRWAAIDFYRLSLILGLLGIVISPS